ncbi:uncharacterized protein F4822DRAFT_389768 [Hypoxylon trugodes]|uniref:uncharacterized protein n=1 Tax=Hypoxylon trugodes TaxID=326681 RepID=UPI00219EB12E|nr:uncharacterized protein F4822DRAFT_389768 [Hypoxylon trugodes]KAI1392153.1 hypothetical protein F4822DRAFT_389768 [Hypoxylon trugodes]
MSEHPYNYGQYLGQQPPLPYTPPSSHNSQQPFYGVFQQPVPLPALGNYATVNNSFQYNASSIPGLGMGNLPPSVSHRPQSTNTWNSQSQASQQNLATQPREQPPAATSQQGNFHENATSQQSTAASKVQADQTLEEGELSEGEFDDLYEPQETVDIAPQGLPSKPPSITENQNGSVGDADGSSIYDGVTPRGEAISNSTTTPLPAADQEYSPDEDWEPTYEERERSGSYSPYLSPREIHRKLSVSKPALQGAKSTPTTQQPIQSLPGLNMAPLQQPPAANASLSAANSIPAAGVASTFRSVTEAKKKAQEAILALWPLKVRFQDYIDEGLDEKVVKSLFADLGLEASIPKTTTVVHKAPAESEIRTEPSDPSKAAPDPQSIKGQSPVASSTKPATMAQPTTVNGTTDAKTAAKTAAEERKDKIARKLAAKAQKPPVAAQSPIPAPSQPTLAKANTTATPASASPAKTKTRAENNAILHQKLAALKRAQEKALAEKKLAEDTTKSTPSQTMSANNAVAVPGPGPGPGPAESAQSSTTVSVPASEPNRRSVSTEKSLPKEAGIPGLFLVTPSTQPPPNRNLKRPVAADFDNYPNPIGSLKRTRTQETLIIDVSDDEDVEMDIGSPTDEPNSSTEIVDTSSQQFSRSAFPPLTNSNRNFQNSSPSSATIPTPPVNGAKLSLLHKRIEETKRRIAEAEAKKAARVNASQSPQAPPPALEAIELPKLSELSQAEREVREVKAEKRNRIISIELPEIEAIIKERQERLKQIVAQATQLELEIQEDGEKRQRLLAEAEAEAEASPYPDDVEIEEQVQPVLSDAMSTTPQLNNVVESQPADIQRSSSESIADVSMSDGEDSEPENEPITNGVQPSLVTPQSDSPVREQAFPILQPSTIADEDPQPEVEDDNIQPPNISADVPPETNEPHLNITNTSVTQIEGGQDEARIAVPQQQHRDSSPSSDDSYKPELASPTHIAPLSEPENNPTKPQSPQEQNHAITNVQPGFEETLNNAGPSQSIDESAPSVPENPSGEVQDSSSHEHPLLTSTQDDPEQNPQVEDILSYHSPLGYFRAYRFHPKYFDEVAGGLKSMTYSSKIDPMRPICPHVLSGEQCPDGNACEFQHFENMVLPDAEIITQLGSADMFTGETRNKFIEGLKKVLNELKANKVKDFDRITRAIVKHRQEFLEDKSKVLPLDTNTG